MTLRVEMLNRALLRIGANPLIGEDDPGAPQHLAVYDSVAEDLASKPFTFFKTFRQLPRYATSPGIYLYAYQMPPDRCGPPRAIYPTAQGSRPCTDFDIVGDMLLTNLETVFAKFTVLRSPERWPGDFREAFTTSLMAELALSVREDRPLHDRLFQKARGTPTQNGLGGLIGGALENDSQSSPSTIVGGGVNPLVDVR